MISLYKVAFMLLALVCVAEECYDLNLQNNFAGHFCFEHSPEHCGHSEIKDNCCMCGGGSSEKPTSDNCTNIPLPEAWNGSCDTSPFADNLAYCGHAVFQSNCCLCGGGNIDPCANNTCNTTGTQTCSANGDSYNCVCKDGFNGDKCQNNVDDCANHQCKNGSTCVDGTNSYSCQCQSGYNGDFCENEIPAGEISIKDSGINVDGILSLFGHGNMVANSGDGTWYDWTAQDGTCSLDLNGSSPLMKANKDVPTSNTNRLGVALNAAQFALGAESLPCGMCLEARAKPTDANGVDPISTSWTPVIIQDKCPDCQSGDLDFVRAGTETGRFDIEWRAVPCPVTETANHNMQLRWVGANLAYAIKVQVRNTRYPVKSMGLYYNNEQFQLKRTPDNHFTNNGVSGIAGPLSFPITAIICDIYNQCVFTCLKPAIQNKEGALSSQTYDIDVQFPEKNNNINQALSEPTLISGQDKRCPDLGGLFGPGCGENCGKWLPQTHHHIAGDVVTHNGTQYKSQGWTNAEPNVSVWAWQG